MYGVAGANRPIFTESDDFFLQPIRSTQNGSDSRRIVSLDIAENIA